jgi:hypothetical protein
MMFVPHGKHLWTSTACYRNSFIFLYVDVRTSLETHAFTACYRYSFTPLCVEDGRTSQETPMDNHGLLPG